MKKSLKGLINVTDAMALFKSRKMLYLAETDYPVPLK
jgi:hypothetical protein